MNSRQNYITMCWTHCIIAFAVAAVCIHAAHADWDGTPTGPAQASGWWNDCYVTSTLDPNPALQMEDCVWMHDALMAQGFTEQNGWTINFGVDLDGTITIRDYFAWVINEPVVLNRHGTPFGGQAAGPIGGAVLGLDYDAGPGDPTGGDVHWIQVINTDCPSNHGQENGHNGGGGYWEYIDNAPNSPGNPFYDEFGAAGSDWFLDIPYRHCGDGCDNACDWEAQVFLATGNLITKTLDIYEDGVWWGFELECQIPAPGALLVLALGFFTPYRRRRSD